MATDCYIAPYVDSSVFIAWINKEVVEGVDRFAIADSVVKNAERGKYLIYISALTLSEVHKLPRGTTPPLTKEQDEMIIRFFQNDCFKVLPVDRDIGETANRFCRDYGIHGNDATHLACALRAKCRCAAGMGSAAGHQGQPVRHTNRSSSDSRPIIS